MSRKYYNQLRAQLDNERSSFLSHWRDLNDYIMPRRSKFTLSDVNRGDRRNLKIIDSTATMSARILRSGMMGGITSPARPWFRLTTHDPDINETKPVKDWLDTVTNRINTVFLRSNLYNILPIVYGDLGVFGTAAMGIEEDFSNDVVRFYSFPVGSYKIATDDKLDVRIFMREFRMTVSQVVEKFGRNKETGAIDWSNISMQVQSLYESGNTQAWIDVCHVIEPNKEQDNKKIESKFKKYKSVYYELGTNSGTNYLSYEDDGKLLSEKGYDFFPVMCPRWEVSGEDVYGTDCPGMVSLGDIKQLQLGEKRAAQAIEKQINPPMVGPTHLKNAKASILPGDITYLDEREGQKGFRPAHELQFNLGMLEQKQEQIRQRIRKAFFEDLFLMLANTQRSQITAREVEERHEEKLLALGPVLEQLNQDLLDPLIDNTFSIMLNQGLIPNPPNELQGQDLKVEYISIMAQAQKLVGIATIDRFVGFVGGISQVSPTVLDKIDSDKLVDVYADLTGISPVILRGKDEIDELRAKREKAVSAQQQNEQMQQMGQTASNLSKADLSTDNALSRLVRG